MHVVHDNNTIILNEDPNSIITNYNIDLIESFYNKTLNKILTNSINITQTILIIINLSYTNKNLI